MFGEMMVRCALKKKTFCSSVALYYEVLNVDTPAEKSADWEAMFFLP